MPSVFARPNKFKGLSYSSILSCDMGKLIPCYRQEVVPGDEFKVSADTIVRLAPMLAPIFGEINLWIHFFFVPNRLLWKNFEDFVTNGLENGVTQAVHPYVVAESAGTNHPDWEIGSLADYLGIAVGGSPVSPYGARINALPFRAYNKIYNDWYRNEFLDTAAAMSVNDGFDSTTNRNLLYRNWKRDYFTSALPFRQLGNPVSLPLGTQAPVMTGSTAQNVSGWAPLNVANVSDGGHGANDGGLGFLANTGDVVAMSANTIAQNSEQAPTNLYADLSNATAATVNDLRTAFQMQRIMERKARSGNRYVEYIASAFGVRSPDARLQRAEFLGGGRAPIMISEVLQTSAGTSTSPQGNMSGHGFGASRTFAFNKAFTEHGWILGILSVMPKPSYFQGIPRDFLKDTWTDYYQPELAHLGEQAIYDEEVCVKASKNNDRGVWAYQPMYEHMRRRNNEIHGDFRSNMRYWTTARAFSQRPVFNSDFVDCDASAITQSIFAAGQNAVRPVWVQMQFNVRAIRPLPKHGTPGLIDH